MGDVSVAANKLRQQRQQQKNHLIIIGNYLHVARIWIVGADIGTIFIMTME